jgi:hypothetical protein
MSFNLEAKQDNCFKYTRNIEKLLDFNKELSIQVEKAKKELKIPKLELRLL